MGMSPLVLKGHLVLNEKQIALLLALKEPLKTMSHHRAPSFFRSDSRFLSDP